MNKIINVMVTGAGSGVGQGIIKALQLSNLSLNIISADISAFNAGLYVCNDYVILPKLENEDNSNLEKVIKIIKDKKLNLIFIGSEFDLEFFCKNKTAIESATQCQVVVFNKTNLDIGNDKFKTVEFLKNNNLPHAQSFAPTNLAEALQFGKNLTYPFILKPRQGTSNRNVHLLENEDQLKQHFDSVKNPIIQELINHPSSSLKHEYTCSVFKTLEGTILTPFTTRRTLRSGNSWIVEVKQFEKIHSLMKNIAQKMDFIGSLNVQLMENSKGDFIPFEFNPRFSGTTAIRAYFGYNEPEMYIKNCFLKETLPAPVIRTGVAFRYLEEIFVEGVDSAELHKNSKNYSGIKASWFGSTKSL